MSGKSKIEWTDRVWNPVSGCSKISAGCKNCYAERMAKRLAGRAGYPARDPFAVTLHEDKLIVPTRWRKPSKVFVCSMADLFHEDVPTEYIWRVLDVIRASPKHTFQVLTKRADRMRRVLSQEGIVPLPNLWLGVSVEEQGTANVRIPDLMEIPAAVKWVSCEPLLGPLDLERWLRTPYRYRGFHSDEHGVPYAASKHLDWVVVGGESGTKGRPCHPDWVRLIQRQCEVAGVPFMFKQWGEWKPVDHVPDATIRAAVANAYGQPQYFAKIGKSFAGRELDGNVYDEYPQESSVEK